MSRSLGCREVKLFGSLLDLFVAQYTNDTCQDVKLGQSILSSDSIRRLEFSTYLLGQLYGCFNTIYLLSSLDLVTLVSDEVRKKRCSWSRS